MCRDRVDGTKTKSPRSESESPGRPVSALTRSSQHHQLPRPVRPHLPALTAEPCFSGLAPRPLHALPAVATTVTHASPSHSVPQPPPEEQHPQPPRVSGPVGRRGEGLWDSVCPATSSAFTASPPLTDSPGRLPVLLRGPPLTFHAAFLLYFSMFRRV